MSFNKIKQLELNALFSHACETGNTSLANEMLKQGANNRDQVFQNACQDNNFICVKIILSTVYDDDKKNLIGIVE